MQKLFLTLIVAVSAFCLAGPIHAADKPEKAPAEKSEKQATPPFNGKIAAVDVTAKTITIGKRTFLVTPASKVMKDGKTATLADAKVGDQVGGQYREAPDGKLEVLSLRIGPKPPADPKGK